MSFIAEYCKEFARHFLLLFFVYFAIYYLRLALLGVNKSQIIFSHKKCHISWSIRFQLPCQFFPLWDFSLSQSFTFFLFLLLCKDPTLNLSSRNGALHNFLLNLLVVRRYFKRQQIYFGITLNSISLCKLTLHDQYQLGYVPKCLAQRSAN